MFLAFRLWNLMFWAAPIASLAFGWLAFSAGIVARPVPLVLWFAAALYLQVASGPLSAAWAVGLAAQSVLAIYLAVRVKLDA